MPPIPELQAHADYPFALLPDGVYPCDESAFRVHFVDRFPDSPKREPICADFFRLRAEAAERGIIATQWVNGSFVEGKPDPGDVDVVSFCDMDFVNNLNSEAKQFLVQYLNGREATKATHSTHSFLVVSCSAAHPYYATFEAARVYWRKWFGKTRDVPHPSGPTLPGRLKGFVQMALGDVSLAPIIATERGAA